MVITKSKMANRYSPDVRSRALYVFRQQRLLIRSDIAERMIGVPEKLMPAKDLIAIDGIEVATSGRRILNFYLLFDYYKAGLGPRSAISVRRIIQGRLARKLARRHLKNRKPIVTKCLDHDIFNASFQIPNAGRPSVFAPRGHHNCPIFNRVILLSLRAITSKRKP